jgi:hypothetical protein
MADDPDQALIVFAKVPRPGAVKTRLTPVLTPGEAARLYRAFLADALEQYAGLAAAVRLYVSPPLPGDGLDGVLPAGARRFDALVEQSGEGLGERMRRAFADAFDAGYRRACIVGTDHPTLPTPFVRQGLDALSEQGSVCIGPSSDGGFYLLGMSRYYPQLFDDMRYSHPRVFSETLARVERTDARLTVLPRWYDVDTPQALRRMLGDLPGEGDAARHTRRAVDALGLDDLA